MEIAILPLHTLTKNESIICALPFGKEEQARLRAIPNTSRAIQSLGALLALQKLMPTAPSPIRRTPKGKPYFDMPDAPSFSLTHTDGIAIAVLGDSCEGNVGVDIENIRPLSRKERIASRFFSKEEQALLSNDNSDTMFLGIWTAKEAIAKLDGMGLISLSQIANDSPCSSHLRHFLIQQENITSVLCVAAEHPIQRINWHIPPAMQIQEL